MEMPLLAQIHDYSINVEQEDYTLRTGYLVAAAAILLVIIWWFVRHQKR